MLTTLVVGANGLPVNTPMPHLPHVKEVVEAQDTKVACVGCTVKEQKTASYFYERGVTDRAALAVILGNIKQESKFTPNICEGGALIPYSHCRSGGYGLIQWTSSHRYYGLGTYARSIGKTPEDFETQLEYITKEREWKAASGTFKTPGLNISRYNKAAYVWLGWGITGRRVTYAYNYLPRIVIA